MKTLFKVLAHGVFLALLALFVPTLVHAVVTSTSSVRVTVNGRDIVNTNVSENLDEHIKNYNTDSSIRVDGSMQVVENIEYFFRAPRHGIIRTIPYVKTNADGKRFALTISNITVTDRQGGTYTTNITRANDTLTIKIGDADKTIQGLYTYIISYDVAGAMTYFPGHDELYWNAIGTQWKVPILSAQTVIEIPQGIAEKDINTECFIGAQKSTEKNCSIGVRGTKITMKSTRPLVAYEGLTAVLAVPKGTIAVLEPTELVPFFDTLQGKVVAVVLVLIAMVWYVLLPIRIVWRWWKAGRDPKPTMGEAKAWFSPPSTKSHRVLTPAETGTLVDETVDLRDIYASIVDLARRGYLKIIEKKKEEFQVMKVKDWDTDVEILPYEKILLDGIFEEGDIVSLGDLDLQITFEKVKKTVYEFLVLEGYFAENPQTLRTKYGLLAMLSVFTFNPILLLVSVTFGQHMPRKTIYGADSAAMARALKSFLISQEKKLAFQADKQMMFEKLLPFAIAFGVEEIWAKRFKDLGLSKPDWYVSNSSTHFNSVVFARGIGNGMSMSFAVSVQHRSSTGFSSGFSSGGGGGSSGGGGGGGGGGSW
jgi:hypothetical protein